MENVSGNGGDRVRLWLEQLARTSFADQQLQIDSRLSIPQLVELACVLEAAAPKAGNVHPEASFHDTSFRDFVESARTFRHTLETQLVDDSLGAIIFEAVQKRRAVCHSNTNLGIILLVTPLALGLRDLLESESQSGHLQFQDRCINSACQILSSLSQSDSDAVFKAIAVCNPGGLGASVQMDVNKVATSRFDPDATDAKADQSGHGNLMAAMSLASRWDDVAAEYVNRFEKSRWIADQLRKRIRLGVGATLKIGRSILEIVTQVQIEALARWPDTLIVRKTDIETAQQVQQAANDVLVGNMQFTKFDSGLRRDGNQLNPGTTADLIAAGLFLYLAAEAYSSGAEGENSDD